MALNFEYRQEVRTEDSEPRRFQPRETVAGQSSLKNNSNIY